jgi:hypothetical protein
VHFKTINSGVASALKTLTLMSFLVYAANTALANSLVTRADYVGSPTANAPAIILIPGNFAVGSIPVVTLGDISTATTSGNPALADLVVKSYSTTDIAVTVSHPLDSGLLLGTYRLDVRTAPCGVPLRQGQPAWAPRRHHDPDRFPSRPAGLVEFGGRLKAQSKIKAG